MKFLKNVFGSNTNKKSKYQPNTLAEANGSPDLRLATTKEKEPEIPVIMKEEVKKIPKKSTTSTASKTKNPQPEIVKAPDNAKDKKVAEKPEKTVKSPAQKKDDKPASAPKSEKKPPVDKPEKTPVATKTATKKAAPVPAKVEPADGAKNAKKKAESPAPEAKKEPKSTPAQPKKDVPQDAPKKAKAVPKKASEEPVEALVADEVTVSKSARTGKFEIKKSKDGRFVFNLYASNSVIVATSQVYSSSTSAMNGIKSVIANAATAPVEDQTLKNVTEVPYPKWEIYLDKGEQYRFRLCASNGSCVCHSQGYTSKASCKKGIESIIKFASDAEITKAYLEKKDK